MNRNKSPHLQQHKPTAEELRAAYGKQIPDCIAMDLPVLMVGINPSLYSAAVGHHFARPGNRFWPALHRGGFTPRELSPGEDQSLPEFGCGLTNIVARATARADELSAEELQHGGRRLVAKVKRYRPCTVALLGVTAYRAAFERKTATIGPQEHTIGSANIWVLPNPSGLNAHYQLPELAKLFAALHRGAFGT